MARITLLTDFGTKDGYVGAMKGVIASILPNAIVDDVSHDVAPGDIEGAAFALGRYWDLYPDGTVHLIVVDPGVGTGRRALAAQADGRFLVAPDNGVLSRVLDAAVDLALVRIADERLDRSLRSATFHGRDVFAPAAAHLARGLGLSKLGLEVDDPVRVEMPPVDEREGEVVGSVVAVDRFGNLLTNLGGPRLAEAPEVVVAGRTIPIVKTYGEGDPLQIVALVNSDDRVEVAARDGSAAELLSAGVGARVRILRK